MSSFWILGIYLAMARTRVSYSECWGGACNYDQVEVSMAICLSISLCVEEEQLTFKVRMVSMIFVAGLISRRLKGGIQQQSKRICDAYEVQTITIMPCTTKCKLMNTSNTWKYPIWKTTTCILSLWTSNSIYTQVSMYQNNVNKVPNRHITIPWFLKFTVQTKKWAKVTMR